MPSEGKPGQSARSASRVIGANDRINVAVIGIGSIGSAHLRTLVPQAEETKDIQVTGASDLYTKRRELARTIAKLEERQVHLDYHDLLARSDVDAVIVAVPENLSFQFTIAVAPVPLIVPADAGLMVQKYDEALGEPVVP